MSDNQVRALGKSKGATDAQIESVLGDKRVKSDNKVNANRKSNSSDQVELKSNIPSDLSMQNIGEFNTNNNDVNNKVDEEESKLKLESKVEAITSTINYFGYNIFERDPEIFQSTNVGAINPDYLIGPGDDIIIMLWGETEFRQVLKVDKEGFVFIPEVGQVFVNGLSLNLLESKLFRVFSQAYQSLNPQGREATTFLDISLGNLRPLRIQVLGEVAQPGAYTISPSATLFLHYIILKDLLDKAHLEIYSLLEVKRSLPLLIFMIFC